MSYQVLARKWRPATFDQVVGQEHVLKALTHALEHNRLHHAYLFTGTRGVGKTSIARLLAKGLNCEQGVTATPCGQCDNCQEINQGRFVDLLEIDAASRTKVDDTREILDNVQYQPVRGRFKVYLIDEVHMLSRHSFNALLKTLEEPPEHVKFLLATTDPQKLPVTVLSRCLQFNLKSVTPKRIAGHLAKVLDAEQIAYDLPALDLLAQGADGSVRDGMSLTDQAIAHGAGELRLAQVQAMLGTLDSAYALKLLDTLCQGEPAQMLRILDEVESFAPDHDDLLRQMAAVLHQVALAQFSLKTHSDLASIEQLDQLASRLDREQIQLWYQILTQGRKDLALAPDPRSGLEMTLLRALAFAPVEPLPPLQARQVAPPVTVSAAPGDVVTASTAVAAPSLEATKPSQSAPADLEAPAVTVNSTSEALPSDAAPSAPQAVPVAQASAAVEPVAGAVRSATAPAAPEADEASLLAEQQVIRQQAEVMQSPASSEPVSTPAVAPPSDLNPPPFEQDEAAMAAEQAMLMAQAEEMIPYDAHFHEAAPSEPEPMVPPVEQEAAAAAEPALPAAGLPDLISQVLANQQSLSQRAAESSDSEAAAATPEPTLSKPSAARPKPEAVARGAAAAESNSASLTEAEDPMDRPPWVAAEDTPTAQVRAETDASADKPALRLVETQPSPEPRAEPQVAKTQVPAESASEAMAPPASDDERELDWQWYSAMAKLGIGARPRQLAVNSVLSRQDDRICLSLRSDQRHLNNESVIAPLKHSLEQLWQTEITLTIEIADKPGRETPLEIRRRRHKERLVQAREELLADPAIAWFQAEMDAKLIEESVSYQTPETH
ncbi:DNA polymerase III subunit gamma/tau [Ferrimonas pelagia]|uniref:DNA-directed DNA polymerase n=1 Tax=Ferrimonas pelagia TaxID=1177826 RepID=A0ABP9F1A0_9GAMM